MSVEMLRNISLFYPFRGEKSGRDYITYFVITGVENYFKDFCSSVITWTGKFIHVKMYL